MMRSNSLAEVQSVSTPLSRTMTRGTSLIDKMGKMLLRNSMMPQRTETELRMDQVQESLKRGLKSLNKMETERQSNIKMFDKELHDRFDNERFVGLYSWLKVQTDHDGLVKKLRKNLIENL